MSMMSEFNEIKKTEERDHIIIEEQNENRTSVMKSNKSESSPALS